MAHFAGEPRAALRTRRRRARRESSRALSPTEAAMGWLTAPPGDRAERVAAPSTCRTPSIVSRRKTLRICPAANSGGTATPEVTGAAALGGRVADLADGRRVLGPARDLATSPPSEAQLRGAARLRRRRAARGPPPYDSCSGHHEALQTTSTRLPMPPPLAARGTAPAGTPAAQDGASSRTPAATWPRPARSLANEPLASLWPLAKPGRAATRATWAA